MSRRLRPWHGSEEDQYLELLRYLLTDGRAKSDRTGTGTASIFGEQLRFSLRDTFPLLTTKTVNFCAIRAELLWFLSGSTNIHDLDARIWDEWADNDGDLGPIYGKQWRAWTDECDQITAVQHTLRQSPDSRRHVVSAWNVADLGRMRLLPCHVLFQFYSHTEDNQRWLSCQVYQRSADIFLGVPFNIASYALLTCMMAQATGHQPYELVWTGGDIHLYDNHHDQANRQLRQPRRRLPRLWLHPRCRDIDDFTADDIRIVDYTPGPVIRAPVAI